MIKNKLLKNRRRIFFCCTVLVFISAFIIALAFLWYPILQEGRLGRVARARAKMVKVFPQLEDGLRAALLLPKESQFKKIQQNIAVDIGDEMDRIGKDEEPIIREAAVTLFLYMRPNFQGIALPIDPGQAPLENANNKRLYDEVTSNPNMRHRRNVLLWEFLSKKSPKDMEQVVEKSVKSVQKKQLSYLNPLSQAELFLRKEQLKNRIGVAYQHTKENLQAGNGAVFFTINPEEHQWDGTVMIMDVMSKRFSSLYLENIDLEFVSTPSAEFKIYRDTNNDRMWQSNDQLLSEGTIEQAHATFHGVHQLVDSAMEVPKVSGVDPYYGVPMFDSSVISRFFITSTVPLKKLMIIGAEVKLQNAVSGKQTDPEAVRFLDDETTRYQTK